MLQLTNLVMKINTKFHHPVLRCKDCYKSKTNLSLTKFLTWIYAFDNILPKIMLSPSLF